MLRILRAFAWMRWRIFVNSLEKTGARDVVERFSVAIEHVGPLIAGAVMIPSALALAGLGGYAGYDAVARGAATIAVRAVAGLMLAGTLLAVVGPMLMPAADRTNPVRLLLLPIPRTTLYVAQAAAALSDPWIVLLVPMIAALPIGMLVAGAPGAAVAALAAGVLALLAIVALSALATSLVHQVLRDRRRGELVALAFVLVLPLVSLVPAAIGTEHDRQQTGARAVDDRPRPGSGPSLLARAARMTPAAAYTATIVNAAQGRARSAASGLAWLAASAAALHGVSLLLFGRVIASPLPSGARRTAAVLGIWDRTLPGLSPPASAVALAHVRLALRTPRGRSILFSPVLMLVFFGLLTMKLDVLPFANLRVNAGLALAVLSSAVSLLAVVPIALNQFAVDGAGLTMTLLSPLSSRQVIAGKAVGGGLVALGSALLCVALSAAVFRGGSPSSWLSLVLALGATYVLASPAAALFSVLFPRVVDMNSIGRGSNAHGLSGLLGLAAFGLAALPCIGLIAAAQFIGAPGAAPLLLLGWGAASYGAARLLFVPVERVFESRRENLAMLM